MKQLTLLTFVLFFVVNLNAQTKAEYYTTWKDKTLPDSTRFKAWNKLVWQNSPNVSLDSLYQFSTEFIVDAKLVDSTRYIVLAMRFQGIAKGINRDYEASILEFQEALDFCIEHNVKSQLQLCYSDFAITYQNSNQYKQAIIHFEKALELAKRKGNLKKTGNYLHDIGSNYWSLGQFDQAMTQYQKSLKIREQIGDKRGIGACFDSMGTLFMEIGEDEKGLEYYEKSRKIHEERKDFKKLAITLNNLGLVHTKMEKFEESLEYLFKAVDVRKQIGDEYGVARSHTGIGSNYGVQNKYDEALKYFGLALTYFEGLNNPSSGHLGEVLGKMGYIYKKKGDINRCIELNERALSLVNHRKISILTQGFSEELYESYKEIGNYQKALSMHELYVATKDSLVSEKNEREIIKHEFKYEYEKQALADSLAFAQKETIATAQIKTQQFGLVALIMTLLFLAALAYSIFKSRQRAQAETARVTELDAFKSQFYTNITHEFRTPLTVILGMTQQIKEQPKKYLKEGLQLIERNGKNLLTQINQILDLSKLETKSFKLNYVQNDVVAFLRYTTESFQSYANGQNLSLRFFSPIEELEMSYDPDYLQKIMQNLISNALKHTPSDGEIKVYLNQSNNHIEIKVKDTGVGISEKDLPNIFDRFYQVDSSESSGGTGIGLAYVKELVRVMEGEISVESEVRKGSSFLVKLPIKKDVPILGGNSKLPPKFKAPNNNKNGNNGTQKLDGNSKLSPNEDTPNSSIGLPKLLLIEDNPDVVTYLKTCLDDQYQIDIAYNGRIGIEKALETIPDIIISDVMMPEVGGYEVCDKLKNDERTSHIPIILLTAKADLDSKIKGLKRGADAYLSKPFDKEELLIRLERMVEKQKNISAYFTKKIQNGEVPSTVNHLPSTDIQIEDVFIQKVRKVVEENYSDEHFALPNLCQKIGMSRSQLFRKMKALINESPSAFIRNYRLNKGRELLENSDMNVSEVAWEVGFKDVAHFSKAFLEKFGESPSAVKV